ncbi:hypothetical protein HELRODRAFT_161855 [Helobdella robusta]|uniref:UmuC domain-containing protein n=1 Tax=Helobdella robusta TaxID=6412 RepID=T1ERY9_HELRO|nr:hypothetical protein HELRODRAFT_161855 [Helobdella robusta]ESO02570.1 hypothetical protein HELRODRAFT_161855 [Helobdella robusta]
MDRVIGLIDMDCFYVQVEQRADPSLAGLPCAVVQYRTYKGGGIIAVNYEARHLGVTRGMMGDEAKAKCPVIHLVRVPESRGKANLTKLVGVSKIFKNYLKYREAGAEVTIDLLPNTIIAEYHGDGEGGVIEDSLDLAESEKPPSQILTKLWLENRRDKYNVKLAIGACIIEEMRAEIFKVTRFKCSAGISHNKVR